MEIKVTFRASQETHKRLQELSKRYGVSQSALLSMLVHERWLSELGGQLERGLERENEVPGEETRQVPVSGHTRAQTSGLVADFGTRKGRRLQKRKRH